MQKIHPRNIEANNPDSEILKETNTIVSPQIEKELKEHISKVYGDDKSDEIYENVLILYGLKSKNFQPSKIAKKIN